MAEHKEATLHNVFILSLGEFKDLNPIGGGGNGSVLKADHNELGSVAVKIFHKLSKGDLAEINFLIGPVKHPNIVPLYAVVVGESSNDLRGLVMHYMKNGSLYDKIHGNDAYDLRQIYSWVKQTALGLDYLHGKKAPEILTSDAYDYPADIYSFSLTIWEMIHRKMPFIVEEEDPKSFQDAIISGNRPSINKFQEYQITDLYEQGWNNDPSIRTPLHEFKNLQLPAEESESSLEILVMPEDHSVQSSSTLQLPASNNFLIFALVHDYIITKVKEYLVQLDEEQFVATKEKLEAFLGRIKDFGESAAKVQIADVSMNLLYVEDENMKFKEMEICALAPPLLTAENLQKVIEFTKHHIVHHHKSGRQCSYVVSVAAGDVILFGAGKYWWSNPDLKKYLVRILELQRETVAAPTFPIVPITKQLHSGSNRTVLFVRNREESNYSDRFITKALKEHRWSSQHLWGASDVIADNGNRTTFASVKGDSNNFSRDIRRLIIGLGDVHVVCLFLHLDYDYNIFKPIIEGNFIPKENLVLIRVATQSDETEADYEYTLHNRHFARRYMFPWKPWYKRLLGDTPSDYKNLIPTLLEMAKTLPVLKFS